MKSEVFGSFFFVVTQRSQHVVRTDNILGHGEGGLKLVEKRFSFKGKGVAAEKSLNEEKLKENNQSQ